MEAKKTRAKKSDMSFEAGMAELERIVNELEGGKLPLSDMLSLYERGSELGKKCADMLDAFEGKLEALETEEAREEA